MTLQTRKPTGAVPWPLILIEGGEKTGKSYAAALLSASEKVGRTFWLDWGEGAADEYGAIPGTRYEVVVHDGTWPSIFGQVEAVRDEAQRAADAGEPPVVLVIDSITAEWDFLKDWAAARARSTEKARKILEKQPNAEITVTQNLWNDANARHRKLMLILMRFPGIVVLTGRGGEVAKVEGGKPVEGEKVHRVEAQKGLGFDVSFWLRLSREARPLVVGARSVHHGIRPGIDEPMTIDKDDWSLEWLIFEVLKCDPSTAHVRDLAEPNTQVRTPEEIRDEACHSRTTVERIREMYREAQQAGYDGSTVVNESNDEENLLDLLTRIGRERGGNSGGQRQAPQNGRPTGNGQRNGATAHASGNAKPSAQRAPQQQDSPADGTAPQNGAQPGEAESEFVRDFSIRLGVASLDELQEMAREIGPAIRHQTIDGTVGNELVAAVAARRRELESAGVPA